MKFVLGVIGLLWKLYILVIFTITAIFFYPIIRLQLGSMEKQRKAFKAFVAWSRVFKVLCFYGVKKIQSSPLPQGPYLILANHSSYLDIFLMYSVMPDHPFLFLGKSEILKYPLIRAYFKRMNIPVYRNDKLKSAKAFIKAKSEVKNGWSIMIFPEGGIPDENPKMIPFKNGAFQLAKSLHVPIVPITFTNNFELFSDPTHILGRAHPGISKVHIHQYISSEEVANMEIAELSQKCFDIINQPILDEYPELAQ